LYRPPLEQKKTAKAKQKSPQAQQKIVPTAARTKKNAAARAKNDNGPTPGNS
jgi:hypothetical protein